MLESVAGKVLASLVSLSALMFTSYTGNEPVFVPLQSKVGHNYLMLKATLDNAFDNDFGDIFKCGKPIHLWFKVEIRNQNQRVYHQTFRHTVTYDPMNATWSLFRSESNQTEIFTGYKSLLSNVAVLECSIPVNSQWKIVEVRTEAWLPEIEIAKPSRTIDLMVLWKFKRPKSRTMLNLESTS